MKCFRFSVALIVLASISLFHSPLWAGAMFDQGAEAMKKGDTGKAIQLFQQAIDSGDRTSEAANNLGAIYMKQNDLSAAEKSFLRALEADQTNFNAYNNLALTQLATKRYSEAVSNFLKSLEINPKQYIVYYNLGEILLQGGELDKSYGMFLKAVEHNEQYAPAYRELARLFTKKKNNIQAQKYYEKATKYDFDNGELHNEFGMALYEWQLIDAAMIEFRHALRVNPKDQLAHYGIGLCLLSKGHVSDAIAAFDNALAIRPDMLPAISEKAISMIIVGRNIPQAVALLKKASDADPGNARFVYNYARGLEATKDLAGAEAAYRKALAIDPTHANSVNNLGLLLYEKGKYEDARQFFEKGLSQNKSDARLNFNHGLTLNKLGQKEKAREAFKAVVLYDTQGDLRERAGKILERLK